jgi:hypothetical protein
MRFNSTPVYLAVLLLAILATACNPAASKNDQDKDWTDAEELVRTSDRVIAGKVMEERAALVDVADSDTGVFTGQREVLYLRIMVAESFKGTLDPDDETWIAFDPSAKSDLRIASGEPRRPGVDQSFVFFLKGRARPVQYSTDFGAVLWTGNGQPSTAAVSGEDLVFLADDIYLGLLESRGIATAGGESAAPFTLTLGRLRELTD